MKVKFSKMHGLGNDFVIIDNLQLKHQFSAAELKFIADRKCGIGCDQILLIEPATDESSDFYYRIYNSDGSIAGQCGNGARCFIRYVVERGLTNKAAIKLQTAERQISGCLLVNGEVEVNMGQPDFTAAALPLTLPSQARYSLTIDSQPVEFWALSMGNPHAVILLNTPEQLDDEAYLARIGQALQTAECFPQSVNVNFVLPLSAQLVKLRTYERGCGFTLACGSGACATAAALIKAGLAAPSVSVEMAGGSLVIGWHGGDLNMTGAATYVFDGEIELCVN